MSQDMYETKVRPRLQSVKGWILQGLDEAAIAQRLGVSCRTLKKYKREHNEFCQVLKSGREEVIAEVEDALIKKAKGYIYNEVKTVDKGDRIETTTTQKEVPPDLSAISFLLRNYCPERWSDKPTMQSAEESFGGVVILPEILKEEED